MRLIDANELRHEISKLKYPEARINMVLAECVNKSPTIDVVSVVRAEWKKDSDYPWLLNCSVCGYSAERGTNYCPNCGAKMEGALE